MMDEEDFPTPAELAQLATKIYTTHFNDFSEADEEEVIRRAVGVAFKIFEASASRISNEIFCKDSTPLEEMPYRVQARAYSEDSLKVGRHYLPELSSGEFSQAAVDMKFEDWLKQAVGLSKHPQRLKVFRDFLEERFEEPNFQKLIELVLGKKPDGVGEVIELLRIGLPGITGAKASSNRLIAEYRLWRVETEYGVSDDLEILQAVKKCGEKAYEHEMKAENETSDKKEGS
ncbi:MAG: hypothetical protein ACSHYB_03830 [Roseibacillus sp.]